MSWNVSVYQSKYWQIVPALLYGLFKRLVYKPYLDFFIPQFLFFFLQKQNILIYVWKFFISFYFRYWSVTVLQHCKTMLLVSAAQQSESATCKHTSHPLRAPCDLHVPPLWVIAEHWPELPVTPAPQLAGSSQSTDLSSLSPPRPSSPGHRRALTWAPCDPHAPPLWVIAEHWPELLVLTAACH